MDPSNEKQLLQRCQEIQKEIDILQGFPGQQNTERVAALKREWTELIKELAALSV